MPKFRGIFIENGWKKTSSSFRFWNPIRFLCSELRLLCDIC